MVKLMNQGDRFREYLKVNRRRILMTVVGVFFAGFSVGLFKNALFGTDPFQVLCAGLHRIIPMSFGTFYVFFNIVLLVAMFFADKRYIGLATLINLFFLGYVVQWSTGLWAAFFPVPDMMTRIIFMLAGIVMLSMAASLYITSDMGVSTYDIWALYFADHTPVPFKYWRIFTDVFCVAVGWILGGKVGVGTLITAFFMGPLIDFFNRHLSQPLLNNQTNNIPSLQAEGVFGLFREISRIARPTGKPERQAEIIGFIESRLQEHGIETRRDPAGNLFAYRPASPDCRQAPGILLQAHVDMVCVPNEDIFPLELVVEGDYLHADGTSCGLDNGMGVALAMSLLINPPMHHGPLEAAFTLNEDTDCYGAINMQPGFVHSRYMISLDDESWGKICIGSAGAEAYTHTLSPLETIENPDGLEFVEVCVSNLTGGHSGYSIHHGQANAIRVCAEIFKGLPGCRLVSLDGGMADNAIPKECRMVIAYAPGTVEQHLPDLIASIKAKNASTDPYMSIEFKHCEKQTNCIADCLSDLILACPNGPLVFHQNADGTNEVQTSSNLASIATLSDRVVIKTLSRSSVKSELDATVRNIQICFKQYSLQTQSENHSSALCWEPDWNSNFLETAKEVFREQNGYEPEVYAPHCYMEGAYFVNIHDVLPIALGPQIDGAHTVGERVQISTVSKCRSLVAGIIEKCAVDFL